MGILCMGSYWWYRMYIVVKSHATFHQLQIKVALVELPQIHDYRKHRSPVVCIT